MNQTKSHPLYRYALIFVLALGAVISMFFMSRGISNSQAHAPALQRTPIPLDRVPMSNQACLECHVTPEMVMPLPSGEELYLTIDPITYRTSVHGQEGYACVQCHTDITGFPHPELEAENLRDVAVYMSQSCQGCHQESAEAYSQGAHAEEIASGNQNAAVCSDCHGAHDIHPFGGSRNAIANTCKQCHSQIYTVYRDSVHGTALREEFNPDVPTCVDCHDHHQNAGPTQEGFHLFSPQICAKCHADESLMSEYGINTNVFETYVTDFHGTTVKLFEKQAPDQETNKPACIDCHGVHDILAPDEETSSVIKANLTDTCRRCHPDATPAFSDAWLSHYPPNLENNTIVFLVDLFYKFFIPGTLGAMAVFVVTDAAKRLKLRLGSTDEDEENEYGSQTNPERETVEGENKE